MGASTTLERRYIAVEPGGEATCAVVVRNNGAVVDSFTISVLGTAQAWAQVEPTSVNLLPEEETTVVVRFRPPRSYEVPAGEVPFGVRISSREDPRGSVVEEGTLDVAAFTDVRLELVPRRARGRRYAKFDLAVDNLANHETTVDLVVSEHEERLRFSPARTSLVLDAGTTTFVALRVTPAETFLRGPERTHPFQVTATGAGTVPVVADGALIQQQLLPKWLLPAIAALLAALIALAALWFTVLRPTIRSTAREAAAEQVQEVAETANAAKAQAEFAEAVASGEVPPRRGPNAGQPPQSTPPDAPPPPPPPGGVPLVTEPIDFRIATDAPRVTADDPGAFVDFPSALPPDKTVLITDIVLQNPLGDTGILRILRQAGDEQVVLLEVGLANFRDLDYHFVEPLRFRPGEQIVLSVNCANPPGRDRCVPSASFSGRVG